MRRERERAYPPGVNAFFSRLSEAVDCVSQPPVGVAATLSVSANGGLRMLVAHLPGVVGREKLPEPSAAIGVVGR